MKHRTLLHLLAAGLLACAPALDAGDSVVVVNEMHYNPASATLEFVELHNQLSVNVDMSGWRFDGGITFQFAEGAVIPARGYLVVAKAPATLQTATGFTGALGPFTGALSNDGETLKLWNNNSALRTRPNPPPSPTANEIWSVDIQGDGAGGAFGQVVPALMSGAGQLLVLSNNAAALLAKYPARPIVGDFTGSLGAGDTLTLEDAAGNPADEVSYEEGGRWPATADGGGASLELRDADADNAAPEAWSPGNTAPLGSWQTISYDTVATDDGQGNDAFKDFLLGMLDSGEFLLDDVSVRENPAGANTEFAGNHAGAVTAARCFSFPPDSGATGIRSGSRWIIVG